MKYLFEVSWEVCNLVGGIHTVLRSKASLAASEFGENYFLIGPLLDNNIDFKETDDKIYKKIKPRLLEKGLDCKLGRWQIDGNPRAILVNFKDRYDSGKVLYQYWQRFGVDSMGSSWDYIEPVLFSTACGEVIETVHNELAKDEDNTVAHFHEWMSGGGLLHLRKTSPEIGTVFTTHATILGRSMSGSGVDIYSDETIIDPAKDAKIYGVPSKNSLETVAAREADVFTTVSNVTADEALKVLGKRPHYAVYNGINATELGSLKEIQTKSVKIRKEVLSLASKIIGQELGSETKLWITSGRYEYRNKGYDIFLESLARLNSSLMEENNATPIVAWFTIATGNEGMKPEIKERIASNTISKKDPCIITHSLHNEHYDSILQACQRLGLDNSPTSPVKVIFTPAYLCENDGLFNMTYYDVLSAFDLGVFPSSYEPWGYTPLESIAFGVPTITSDLAGFGRWAQELGTETGKAIAVVERLNTTHEKVCDSLFRTLEEYAKIPEKEYSALRTKARKIAEMASWNTFYKNYIKSYNAATIISDKRLNSLDTSSFSDELFMTYKGTEGPGPHYRTITVAPQLPEPLSKLAKLAYNLWWAWHIEAQELFEDLDPTLYNELDRNPVNFLEKVRPEKLEKKAKDRLYISKYNRIISQFEDYMSSPGRAYKDGTEITPQNPIAYFSMEFCLHECLPIYSGGLGVLSGDHMKSASDLGLPLVGVGFFYKNGYFQQHVDINGQQIEFYPRYDPSNLPIEELRDEDNQEVRISVPLPGREVQVKIWKVTVGRIKMFLLDTDLEENHPDDRKISSTLYGGGKQTRIEQEIVLGMGGVKVLEDKAGLCPSVYHMNEGHCGFLLFERIERLIKKGLHFQEAREMVKASTVFTTHTPVPAGNETFTVDLMTLYFSDVAPRMTISIEQLLEMGFSKSDSPNQEFSMTVLALKLSSRANGVSKLHGKVCKEMWHEVWHDLDRDEIPIGSITNGIHLTSWIGEDMKRLLTQYLEINWDANQDDAIMWQDIDQIPDETLWYEHKAQKKRLVSSIKEKLMIDYTRRGESPDFINQSLAGLNPEALTIGFARRFATYKRATLLFKNRDSLIKLLNDPLRPVQIFFAGKAHPADTQGKELINQIIKETRTKEFIGKIFYLENYNMKLGRLLTQGVDVWLNTPVRPHEASGTSGMKVVPNGGLNFSILDGWWDEGYDEEVGFSICSTANPTNRNHQDEMDNHALINILMNNIIPTFYDTNKQGISASWVAIMKNAFKKLAPVFSTMRMVDEYQQKLYIPAAKRANNLKNDDYKGIKILTDWKRSIKARFSTAQIDQIKIKGLDGNMLPSGKPLQIEMTVIPGKMKQEELKAELIIGPDDGNQFAEEPQTVELLLAESPDPTVFLYTLAYQVKYSGTFRYALRVVPTHTLLTHTQETGLVNWG